MNSVRNSALPVKIAFFDIDGTLLSLGVREPSAKIVYTLKELQRNGVILCMATGRGVLARPKLKGIHFDAYITFNGSYCFTDEELIHSCPIPKSDVLQILENTKRMGRAVVISNDKFIVANGMDEDLKTYFSFGGENIAIDGDFDKKCKDDIYQMMVSCVSSEYEEILRGTKGISVTAWWDRAADLIPAESGKGKAVKNILDYFGFSKQEAIAFGDGRNDIEMLRAVGTGIAMGNAGDEVKAIADTECKSVEDDGIYYYCVEKGLIELSQA
ncbi:Cof-type HAD-IIB family hydrolase [Selenomonas ruminantium]|nr:Cof-type HAD-IIB family hydrolase [Selenomonas ruminantium]